MINMYNFYDFICVSIFFSIEARSTVISKKLEIRKCKTEFLSSKWSRSSLAIANGVTVKPATMLFIQDIHGIWNFVAQFRRSLTGIVYFIEIHELVKQDMGFLNVLRCFFTNLFPVKEM